jgi:hypothetical protein
MTSEPVSSDISSQEQETSRFAFARALFERGDSIIYTLVGAIFLLGAFLAVGYSLLDFGALLLTSQWDIGMIGGAIIQLITDLLLVLIIMAVLSTVIHHLREHNNYLRPFLFVGVVSATRGILAVGARLSVEGARLQGQVFTNSMIELGINAAVILLLGITLRLLGGQLFKD